MKCIFRKEGKMILIHPVKEFVNYGANRSTGPTNEFCFLRGRSPNTNAEKHKSSTEKLNFQYVPTTIG